MKRRRIWDTAGGKHGCTSTAAEGLRSESRAANPQAAYCTHPACKNTNACTARVHLSAQDQDGIVSVAPHRQLLRHPRRQGQQVLLWHHKSKAGSVEIYGRAATMV